MRVLVLDQRHQPLKPCSEKRARLLLQRGRAVVQRRTPFVIRLLDRREEQSVLQPVVLKLDLGSQTTGMALVRVEQTPAGRVLHALHLAELAHRGAALHQALLQRAGYWRRRRAAHLRSRPPRFLNRRRLAGWLPPSLRSRVDNVLTRAGRSQRWTPLTRIEVERVRFDQEALQDPQIAGAAYQRGTLLGWELWAYVLARFGWRCAYGGLGQVPLELEHLRPKSRAVPIA